MSTEEKEKEFFSNVWDHSNDAFQMVFDARRPLDDAEAEAVAALLRVLREGGDNDHLAEAIAQGVAKHRAFGIYQTT